MNIRDYPTLHFDTHWSKKNSAFIAVLYKCLHFYFNICRFAMEWLWTRTLFTWQIQSTLTMDLLLFTYMFSLSLPRILPDLTVYMSNTVDVL
jgi:hypothetical protein